MNNIKIFTFVLRRILDKIAFEKLLKELKEKYLFSDDFRYSKTFPYQEDKRDIDDIYVDITIIEHYPLKMRENLISNSTRDGKTRALIYGRAGVGNTTLSKYLSYKWAKDELLDEFDLVIYLPLRDWEGNSLKKNIIKYYFPVEREDLDIIIESIKKMKTLFIFDGYDELKEEYKRNFKNILKGLNNYIITSRPYGFYQDEFDVNETFENVGFTDEDVEEYIRKYFKDDEERANRLIERIKDNENTYQMAHIPLMLELICSIEEEQDFTDLTAELYKKVVENVFRGDLDKNREEEISEEDREKILNILGKLAFEGLRRQKIIFDKDFLKEVLEDKEIEFLEGKAILFRFLKTDKKGEELLDNNLEFIHLTFQEYLSAYYVSNLDKEEIKEIIREHKFYPHMQVFFMFLAGLIDDKNFLIKEIKSEPKDILGFYEILFLMSLLSQIRPEELDKELFEEFKIDLFKWIKFTAREEIQYEKLLENLPFIKEYTKVDDEIVDKLIDVINNKNIKSWVRGKVAEVLGKLGRKDDWFVNKLIDVINNENIDIWARGDVAEALGNIGRNDDLVVNTLINFINDKNIGSYGREEVAKVLVNIGRNDNLVVNALIAFIRDESIDAINREYIAKILVNIGRNDNWFINKLINVINNENIYYDVRENMARELGNIGRNDDWFVNKLIDVVNNESINNGVRGDVAIALGNIGRNDDWFINKLIDVVNNENINNGVRGDVAFVLGNIGRNDDWFVNKLIDVVNNENINDGVRRDAAEALANIGRNDDLVVNTLINFINNENIDSWIRGEVAEALANIGRNDDLIVNTLIDFINDESIFIIFRRNIVIALGKIGRNDDLVVNTLINFINNENIDNWIKREVAEALVNIGRNDNLVVNALIDFIRDESISAVSREYIAKILANIGRYDDWFVNRLIGVINNNDIDTNVRRNIAIALGNIGRNDDLIVNALINFINKKYIDSRENIDSRVRGEVAEVLANIGRNDDLIVNTLIDFINDENIYWRDRGNVAIALENIDKKDDLFINKLIDIINSENIHRGVRGYTAIALGNTGRNDDLVINTLIDVINNKNIFEKVKEEVAKVLAKTGRNDNLVVNALINFIKNKNVDSNEFIQYTNTEVVIKAFKENIVDLDFVFLHGFLRILPFYLKENNTLHTIFEGKELKGRKVSEKEIKEALEKIGLTDYQA